MPFSNPIIGGGGALVYPSIHSPNFVASVSGWSINKNGNAEFNGVTIRGTFNGVDFILNTNGLFLYTGVPAVGNLAASIVPGTVNVLDPEGNTAKPGICTYSASGTTYLQMFASTPAVMRVGTGDAIEATPGQLTTKVFNSGATKYLVHDLQAPRVTSQLAGALAEIQLCSPSADLTTSPATININAEDGTNNSIILVKPALIQILSNLLTIGGQVIATGGTAANPSKFLTDVYQPLTLTTPANWTVNNSPECVLNVDQTVSLSGEITAAAAIAAGASLLTLPSGYFNTSTSQRLTVCYNTGAATVNTVLLNISTAGVITTFPGIPNASTLNLNTRFDLRS